MKVNQSCIEYKNAENFTGARMADEYSQVPIYFRYTCDQKICLNAPCSTEKQIKM